MEDQIVIGMGWSNARLSEQGNKCAAWKALDLSDWLTHSGAGGHGVHGGKVLTSGDDNAEETEEEGELEEWEIEAEKHFQEAEDAIPTPPKPVSKPKAAVEPVVSRHNINLIMEQSVVQPLSFEEEQVCHSL